MNTQLSKLLKEPLLHFLLIGGALFLLFSFVKSEDNQMSDLNTITIDESSLLTYMQFRSKNYNKNSYKKVLANMSPEDRQKLIDGYITEEALYREAKSMQLDSDDYIIRRRLVQKMDFITRGISSDLIEPSKGELLKYYKEHSQKYRVNPTATFAHVFFDYNKYDKNFTKTKTKAKSKLLELKENHISFESSIIHGDRFPFHLHYVEKTPQLIASHFNEAFSDNIFKSDIEKNKWQGPFSSPYGEHLVLIKSREKSYLPIFEIISNQVAEDFYMERIEKLQQQAIESIIEGYQISIN